MVSPQKSLCTEDIPCFLENSYVLDALKNFQLWWVFESACIRNGGSTSLSTCDSAARSYRNVDSQKLYPWNLSCFLQETGSVRRTFIDLREHDGIFDKKPAKFLSKMAAIQCDGLFAPEDLQLSSPTSKDYLAVAQELPAVMSPGSYPADSFAWYVGSSGTPPSAPVRRDAFFSHGHAQPRRPEETDRTLSPAAPFPEYPDLPTNVLNGNLKSEVHHTVSNSSIRRNRSYKVYYNNVNGARKNFVGKHNYNRLGPRPRFWEHSVQSNYPLRERPNYDFQESYNKRNPELYEGNWQNEKSNASQHRELNQIRSNTPKTSRVYQRNFRYTRHHPHSATDSQSYNHGGHSNVVRSYPRNSGYGPFQEKQKTNRLPQSHAAFSSDVSLSGVNSSSNEKRVFQPTEYRTKKSKPEREEGKAKDQVFPLESGNHQLGPSKIFNQHLANSKSPEKIRQYAHDYKNGLLASYPREIYQNKTVSVRNPGAEENSSPLAGNEGLSKKKFYSKRESSNVYLIQRQFSKKNVEGSVDMHAKSNSPGDALKMEKEPLSKSFPSQEPIANSTFPENTLPVVNEIPPNFTNPPVNSKQVDSLPVTEASIAWIAKPNVSKGFENNSTKESLRDLTLKRGNPGEQIDKNYSRPASSPGINYEEPHTSLEKNGYSQQANHKSSVVPDWQQTSAPSTERLSMTSYHPSVVNAKRKAEGMLKRRTPFRRNRDLLGTVHGEEPSQRINRKPIDSFTDPSGFSNYFRDREKGNSSSVYIVSQAQKTAS